MDTTKLKPSVLNDLRSRGFELHEIEQMTPEKVFDEVCEWHGLMGWGEMLRGVMKNAEEAAQ